jgi:hypothetical protein
MSKEDLDARLRKVECRLAYLTGAAVVGVFAIGIFLGVTSLKMIPDAINEGFRKKIDEKVIQKINGAAKKADRILEADKLQEAVRKINEAWLCDNPVEECVCQRDVKGTDRAKLVVCVSRCPDGRLIRGIEIREIVATTDKDKVSCEKLQPKVSWQ